MNGGRQDVPFGAREREEGGPTGFASVRLVMGREIRARAANRSFIIGTLVNMVIVAGLLFAFTPSFDEPDPAPVAVTGAPVPTTADGRQGAEAVHWLPAVDEATARRQVADGEVDAALSIRDGRAHAILRADTSPQVKSSIAVAAQQWAVQRALSALHVNTGQLARDTSSALATEVVKGDGGEPDGTEVGTVIGLVTLLFFQLFGYGMTVAQGVVEEKSTRIVEVLLTVITPLRLMTGKVLGIGVVALAQMTLMGAAGVGATVAGGLLPRDFPAVATMGAALVWFVLGFAFFAFLFAAAGSLVSRAEDVASAVMPVLLTTVLPYGAALAAASDLNASWVKVLQYVPPFSMLLMPLRVSSGGAGLVENLLAGAPMVLAAWGMAVLSARVYRRSVLRMGSPVRWRAALSAS
ncbi:ABC transporter permease [Streptomyces varsoviensis]|uniref:ABC transporter permease n=1 Tax=Streptomyces varsoviensis TaxID=67373 RepID=UPI0033D41707